MKNLTFLKKFAAITLAMSFILISGCGSSDAPSETPSDGSESESASESVSEPVELRDPVDLREKLEKGIERNPDTMAWLYIPEIGIDDAVLQKNDPNKSHQENNEYYLRIDEDKKWDIFGCYWADALSNIGSRNDLSKNTVIYGHSDYKDNKDGKKFSKLFHYNDQEFLENNPYIYLTTEEEDLVFQVFSVFYTHIDFVYIYTDPTVEHFGEIIEEAKAKSEYIIDVPVDPEKDKIITLSTCTGEFVPGNRNDYRYVIMGKLLPSSDVPAGAVKVEKNPNPLRD